MAGAEPGNGQVASVMTVPDVLVSRAAELPGTAAVADEGGALTYRALLGEATALAQRLVTLGCRPGERFALQAPNGREWVVAYWAATLAGLVVVPVDARSRPAEVEAVVRRCSPVLLLSTAECDLPDRLDETLVLRATASFPERADVGVPGLDGTVRAGDVHLLQFTSGSTGSPKAAMLTHRGLLANARALADAWGLAANEAIVVPSPLSHILGFLAGCFVPATVGATAVTMAAFAADRALDLIERYRAVGVAGTPTHHVMLVEHPDRPRRDCSSLRFAMHGGAPMTADAARRITEGLGVGALLGGFGMSETSGGVTSVVPGDSSDVQLTSVGRPLPTFEVRVVDPSSGEDRGVGVPGELWVRGEPVCVGYWGDPGETERAFTDDGWLRTGDLVVRRDDGCVRVAGRLKEIILVGGYTVAPGEIEEVLAAHPAVAEAVVAPAPEPRLGEIPVAFVRLAPGMGTSSDELEAHCRLTLASYKVPRHYVFLGAFPVSPTGKIQRVVLRDRATEVVAAALAERAKAP